jgi:TPP-dependent pyruvate/acetoin dehydrogenase alpha subunit
MEILLEIHKKASICRAFEEEVFRQVQNKTIKIPVYLSAGQEYISATLAAWLEDIDKQIFIQHRGHSTYLSFGGNMDELVLELLGDSQGCSGGMGGSASIQSKEKKIYGHDGLMGSQGPIATGACYGNKKFTLCFTGDAAAEEDYFLGAMGWAATKNLPIWYIVEDNNLSILTEKKARRCWEMQDVAKGFKMEAHSLNDDPREILNVLETSELGKPMLLNIKTNRIFWHAGAGIDDPNIFDRHKKYIDYFGNTYSKDAEEIVRETWKKHLR